MAYKDKLYELFGKERTDIEMDGLKFDFMERCGGGLGVTRLLLFYGRRSIIKFII